VRPTERHISYIPALDGLRAIAVTMVIVSHFRPGVLPAGGFVGVTTFFALSGFLITSLLLKEDAQRGAIDLGAFYLRRAYRLLPALVVVLAFVLALGLAQGDVYAGEALAALFYVANVAEWLGHGLGPLAHTWSLAVEEQFYLVWPLAFRLFGRRRTAVAILAVATLAIIGIRFALWSAGGEHAAFPLGFDAILLGCIAGYLYGRGLNAPHWLALGGLAVLAGLCLLDHNTAWFVLAGRTAVPVAALAVVLHVAGAPGSWTDKALSLRPAVLIGRMSYGLYLWHWPLIVLVLHHVGGIAGNALTLALTVVCASASYRYVEQPFLRRKARLSTQRHEMPVASS
jgi:peptidoglycan/LPS O-acetylase OafA/YrhL